MPQAIITFARRFKRAGQALRNAPLFVLCAIVSISVEVFAWGSILAENHATVTLLGQTVRLGYAEVAMSTAFSLAALVLAAAAAAHRADPRPEQRRRAGGAQALAIAVLIAPVYYAGNCLALQRQLTEWREYHGSEAEAADRALANQPMVDSLVRAQAAFNLRRGIRPERAEFDPLATSWVALILGSNMLAIRLGWRARPETPSEAKARLAATRAAKAKHTRALNHARGGARRKQRRPSHVPQGVTQKAPAHTGAFFLR